MYHPDIRIIIYKSSSFKISWVCSWRKKNKCFYEH